MKVNTFRDLMVWQKGMDIAVEVVNITKAMPKSELFALTSQMRRAAASIPMNIAEGFGKHTRPSFIHGLRTAMRSLCELMTACEIAVRANYIKPVPKLVSDLQEEDRMLQSLITKLELKEQLENPPRRTKLRN